MTPSSKKNCFLSIIWSFFQNCREILLNLQISHYKKLSKSGENVLIWLEKILSTIMNDVPSFRLVTVDIFNSGRVLIFFFVVNEKFSATTGCYGGWSKWGNKNSKLWKITNKGILRIPLSGNENRRTVLIWLLRLQVV